MPLGYLKEVTFRLAKEASTLQVGKCARGSSYQKEDLYRGVWGALSRDQMNNWKADPQPSDHDTKARTTPVSECLRHAVAGGLRPLGSLWPLCFAWRLWHYKIASSFSSTCLLSLKTNLGITGSLFSGLRLKAEKWPQGSSPVRATGWWNRGRGSRRQPSTVTPFILTRSWKASPKRRTNIITF